MPGLDSPGHSLFLGKVHKDDFIAMGHPNNQKDEYSIVSTKLQIGTWYFSRGITYYLYKGFEVSPSIYVSQANVFTLLKEELKEGN